LLPGLWQVCGTPPDFFDEFRDMKEVDPESDRHPPIASWSERGLSMTIQSLSEGLAGCCAHIQADSWGADAVLPDAVVPVRNRQSENRTALAGIVLDAGWRGPGMSGVDSWTNVFDSERRRISRTADGRHGGIWGNRLLGL